MGKKSNMRPILFPGCITQRLRILLRALISLFSENALKYFEGNPKEL